MARNGLDRDCPAEIRWERGLVVRWVWRKRKHGKREGVLAVELKKFLLKIKYYL